MAGDAGETFTFTDRCIIGMVRWSGMQPSRFVSLCFVYSGALLVVLRLVVYRPEQMTGVILGVGADLCILFTGLYRLYSETAEQSPEKYGPFAYGMALLSLVLTGLFVFGLTTVQ